MNEHKNTISQSNHSALIISFRIKNHLSTEAICIIVYSLVGLFVFAGFCFCFGICFVFFVDKDQDEELDL